MFFSLIYKKTKNNLSSLTKSTKNKSGCKNAYQQIYYLSTFKLAFRLAPIFIPPMMLSSILLDNYFNSDPFAAIFTFKNLFLVPLMFYPFVVLAVYFYSRSSPLKIISKGVYGRDINGKKVFLKWQEISYLGITYKNLLPYYQLKSTFSQEEVLVPTFIKNVKNFIFELKAHNIFIEKDLTTKENRDIKNPKPLRQGGYIIITTEEHSTGNN